MANRIYAGWVVSMERTEPCWLRIAHPSCALEVPYDAKNLDETIWLQARAGAHVTVRVVLDDGNHAVAVLRGG
jgi:hypothetical protein